MAIKCNGCGIELQFNDSKQLGYSPKAEAEYCQRCFRLTHYDDLTHSMKSTMDEEFIMDKMRKTPGLIVWVLDSFDIEAGLLSGMNRHFLQRDLLVVVTKKDLLPKTITNEKCERFILARLKEENVKIAGLCMVAMNNKSDLEQCMNMIKILRKDQDVLFMGKANAGKSTLLNQLLKQNKLTTTRYPGTTLDFNEIEMGGYKFMDTPGLINQESMLMQVHDKDLVQVIPSVCIKPQIYQLWENQSYAMAGLCRVDVDVSGESTIVFYMSNRLDIHRGKGENADALWTQHQGVMLTPTVDEKFNDWKKLTFKNIISKSDLVIYGLGWVTLSKATQVTIYVPSNVSVILRKALI